jgi:endo-1,4-beta-xylanase
MMKSVKMFWTILLAALVATGLTLAACGDIEIAEPVEAFNSARAAETFTSNKTGTKNGWDYEYWKDSGTGSMTVNDNGTFSCSWSNINNILFRTGKKFNQTQTHNQIGNISITYNASFNPNGNAYLCVYGWSVDPLVEYYIVESWGTYRPTGTNKGTANIGGSTYDLYETTRTNQPSIKGNATFKQYWAVRQSKRTSGTINVTDVFNAWYGKNMHLGKMYEVALTVEGYQSSGNASISSYQLRYGNNTLGSSSSSGSSGGSSSSSGSNSSSGSSNTTTGTTANGVTTVQCEAMTKGGQYTGNISSPFNGVRLYANNDKVSYSQYFANNRHQFTLRGSSTSGTAQVELRIGGTSYGIYRFGTSVSNQTITATHNRGGGNATVELICVNDNGTWDVNLDYLEIRAAN